MNLLQLFATALLLSLLIIPIGIRLATRFGMVDHPATRKVHVEPVTRAGGWGIVLGALAPFAMVAPFERTIAAFLIAVVVLFVFGTWDDVRNLNHRIKFIGQIIAAAVIVFYGELFLHRLPFIAEGELPIVVGLLFSIFALVGAINAVNHSDGLDGLAGGECLMSLGAMAILLALAAGSTDVMVCLGVGVLGSTIGFLRYNWHPARVFMGDTGSQFLGLTVGVLAIYLTETTDAELPAAVVLPLIGMPVIDILVTLGRRIRTGMHWFAGSRNHIHHRLLERGLSHGGAVAVLFAAQALLVVAGLVLRTQSDLVVICAYLAICVGLLGILVIAERRGWYWDFPIAGRRA